ncbi:MAG: hypothetical protein SV186_00505 [Candidatus Nanohaloarchaea archaeon]|nr:hypothetical protein [Candidatus Nanohaloarchaea archaeon]
MDRLEYEDRFYEDVAAVAERVSPSKGDEAVVDVVVHPGFSVFHPEASTYGTEYTHDAFLDDLGEAVTGDRTVVLYPDSWKDATESYLGEPETVEYIATEETSALLTEEGKDDVAGLVEDLESGGVIRLSGEINGCCYTHVDQLFREVEDRVGKEYEVEEAVTYPEDRVWEL